MDLFQRQWATYRAVLDHDLMEHQAMSLACGQVLRQVCATAQAPSLVDLGCGDLGLLAPLLQTLPLGHYTGLDLCAEVLPLAQAALSQAPFPRSWLAEDLLSWANAPQAEAVEVIHSSFAVHHLQQDQDKANWLKGCRRRLAPGGRLIWVDVFRQAGESREAYLARYGGGCRAGAPLAPNNARRCSPTSSALITPPSAASLKGSPRRRAGAGSGPGKDAMGPRPWPSSAPPSCARAGS
ncbi:MAG: class I SAM-dependent methyltransferase [Vulcanococcus sp.]